MDLLTNTKSRRVDIPQENLPWAQGFASDTLRVGISSPG